jgi:glutathione S-transferase
MSELVLYGNRESGHSYKVMLALAFLGLPHEYREVDLDVPQAQRRADFRAHSPFGEVPVLVRDGRALAQSNAILLRLAQLTGRLGGQLDRDPIAQWLFWEANRIGFSLPNLRATLTYARGSAPEVSAWLRARVMADLGRLEEELASRPYLVGSDVTVVDVACCAYLFWPEQAGIELSAWPNIVRWLERIRALPGWAPPYDLLRQLLG